MLNIIVNPHFHQKKVERLLAKVDKRLRERGTEYHIHYSHKAGPTREYARCLSEAGTCAADIVPTLLRIPSTRIFASSFRTETSESSNRV